MWSVIRADEPALVLHPLMDFLRLPSRVQQLVGTAEHSERPTVLVFGNADRVFQHYPDDSTSSRPILDGFQRERTTLVVTASAHPRKVQFEFDFVFELRAMSPMRWTTSQAAYEKAPPAPGYPIGEAIRAFVRNRIAAGESGSPGKVGQCACGIAS
jgi:hypothetical protein